MSRRETRRWRADGSANAVEDGVEGLQRVAGKIHLRDQARENARAEQRKMNVRRTPRVGVIDPRIRARLDGLDEIAPLIVGEQAACAGEVGIQRRIVTIGFMAIAATGVRLPNFNQCAAKRTPIFIEHAPVDEDAFADGLAVMVRSEIVVVGLESSHDRIQDRCARLAC